MEVLLGLIIGGGVMFVYMTRSFGTGHDSVLQPGSTTLRTTPITEGPSLYRPVEVPGKKELEFRSCEFAVELVEGNDADFMTEEERWEKLKGEAETATSGLDENKIGGTPVFLQGDEFPFEEGWQSLLQLDSCSVPFWVNFGDAGVGYAFLNAAGDEAKTSCLASNLGERGGASSRTTVCDPRQGAVECGPFTSRWKARPRGLPCVCRSPELVLTYDYSRK